MLTANYHFFMIVAMIIVCYEYTSGPFPRGEGVGVHEDKNMIHWLVWQTFHTHMFYETKAMYIVMLHSNIFTKIPSCGAQFLCPHCFHDIPSCHTVLCTALVELCLVHNDIGLWWWFYIQSNRALSTFTWCSPYTLSRASEIFQVLSPVLFQQSPYFTHCLCCFWHA